MTTNTVKKTKTWLAVTVTKDGKNYAYAWPVFGSENLVSVLSRFSGLASANICATKKGAAELVTFWNECYKANGSYMFAGGPFLPGEEATA